MDDVRSDRRIKETQAHLGLETKETLRIMQEERCDSPVSMRYFFNLFERHSQGGIPVSSAGSGPTVGTLCIHVPEELIYAAGATPVRLCSGSLAYEQAGADLLPAKACPVVKATVGRLQGIALTGAQEFSLIVSPTSCDQKKKMGELLEEFGYRICYLEVPASKDSEEARIYWRRSVQKLARILEKTTGRTITDRRLSRAIAVVRSAQVAYRNLHQVMKSCTPVIRGTDAMLVSHAYFFDDITSWTGAVNSLVEELKERQRSEFGAGNRQAPRILFAGSPPIFPNLKIPLLIELAGGMLVADEVCSSSRLLYDMVAFDEAHCYDMIPAVADRYLKPCTCPTFNSSLDRRRRLLDLTNEFSIDGVIYQSFAGCMPYALEQRRVGKALGEAGIPVLFVETDYSAEDSGQLATRVEAFLESLKARKRRSA